MVFRILEKSPESQKYVQLFKNFLSCEDLGLRKLSPAVIGMAEITED